MDRVYRSGLLLEEYGPDIEYIKGVDNTVAAAISLLDSNLKMNPPRSLHHLEQLSGKNESSVKNFCSDTRLVAPQSMHKITLALANMKLPMT